MVNEGGTCPLFSPTTESSFIARMAVIDLIGSMGVQAILDSGKKGESKE